MKTCDFRNKVKISTISSFIAASFLVTGCGGGDGDTATTAETITGQFIDSPVEGLAYACSSGNSGVTNSNGEYTCNVGDTVTFSINGFVIGSASAAEMITPYEIAADVTQALNVAQLLQTLDIDGDPSNGITIAQSGALYDVVGTFNDAGITPALPEFDTTVQATFVTASLPITLVGETTAETNLTDGIASVTFDAAAILAALAEKAIYPAQSDPAFYEEWIIAADGLTGTASGIDENGAWIDTASFTYTDTSFTVHSNSDNTDTTFVVTAITGNHIETSLGNLYYSQAEASAIPVVSGNFNITDTAIQDDREWMNGDAWTLFCNGPEGYSFSGTDIIGYTSSVGSVTNFTSYIEFNPQTNTFTHYMNDDGSSSTGSYDPSTGVFSSSGGPFIDTSTPDFVSESSDSISGVFDAATNSFTATFIEVSAVTYIPTDNTVRCTYAETLEGAL